MANQTMSSKRTAIALEPQELMTIMIGVLLFSFMSFLRGMVALSTGFVVNYVSTEVAAIFTLLPILSLLVPVRSRQLGETTLFMVPVLWVSSAVTVHAWSKFMMTIVGLATVLLALKFLIVCIVHDDEFDVGTAMGVIATALLVDQAARSLTNGQDPLVASIGWQCSLWGMLGLFVIFLMSSGHSNARINGDVKGIFNETEMDRQQGKLTSVVHVLRCFTACFGLFGNLMLYILIFGNPGIFTFAFEMRTAAATLLMAMCLGVLVCLVDRSLVSKIPVLSTWSVGAAAVLCIVSSTLFPWYGIFVVFWVLGLASIVFLSVTNLLCVLDNRPSARTFSFAIALSFLINIVLLMELLLTESNTLLIAAVCAISLCSLLAFALMKPITGKRQEEVEDEIDADETEQEMKETSDLEGQPNPSSAGGNLE